MANLFASPEQIQAAETARIFDLGANPRQAVGQGLFALGNALGGAGLRAFGVDTTSPAVRRARELRDMVDSIDWSDNDSIMSAANTLQAEGYTAEAQQILQGMQKPTKPDDQWITFQGPEETITAPDGTTRVQRKWYRQNLTTNRVEEISGIGVTSGSPSADTGDYYKGLVQDYKFDENQAISQLARLANQDRFKGIFGGDADPEMFRPLLGRIQKAANDAYRADLARYLPLVRNKTMSMDEVRLLTQNRSDHYLEQGLQRYVSGGGFNKDVSGSMIGGDEVSPVLQDTADFGYLQQNIDWNKKVNQAQVEVAQQSGKLVRGDPKKGELVLSALEPADAQEIFNRMDSPELGSDEAIRAGLEQRGFMFNDDLYQYHANQWQLMREIPANVRGKFLNLLDSPDQFHRQKALVLKELKDMDNQAQFFKIMQVLKYMGEVAGKPKAQVKGARYGRAGYRGN